jgi:hypothetical protein
MSFPCFVDLHSFYEELRQMPEYGKSQKWLKQAVLRNACQADLNQAADCVTALRSLIASPRKSGTMERAVTEGALLNQAVLLYARATSTGGSQGERGSRSIAHGLTPLQLEDHQALIDIRNRAIAHVYQGQEIDSTVWQRTVPLLIEFPPAFRPCFATQSIQFNRTAFDRLARQLPIATGIMVRAFYEALNKFMEQLATNPVPDTMLRKHGIDPVALFGTPERVEAIVASSDKGQASFVDG